MLARVRARDIARSDPVAVISAVIQSLVSWHAAKTSVYLGALGLNAWAECRSDTRVRTGSPTGGVDRIGT